MDADELRALQAPLKQRYKVEPSAAETELHASAAWTDPGITATVPGWAGPVRAGLHAATGGDGSEACSGDMLLEALIACAGVTMRSVATVMGVQVGSATLTASSTFDARGTLGVSREVPVGVATILIVADLETDADEATLGRLATLTERYCVVGQSLKDPPKIEIRRAG